ncbi:dynein axonemal intermediate chain 3-like [Anopheles nili]|uniref:dynein axonemal intermediate chain 3-like n=1 Tax=Anopheles nili TaxID=185578 RepID=UPI00237BEA8D|nr:dynein axonemal intermediate chain 3-like [Anopheles nili]
MNRSLCIGRSVCAMDWHSEQSGIFVASYTFETLSDLATSLQKPSERPFGDNLNRATFEACTVLLWSFEDTLEPLLELKTIREVTSLSFCPYDANLLVGGLSNGQIVLWADLTDEIERVERAKRASSGSSEYRRQIRAIMEYPIEEKIDRLVNPAAVSSLQHSSRGAITSIKWLPRNHYCTTTGHVKPHADKEFRFMVTASLDGSVCIWDLDFATPALQKLLASAKVNKAQQAERTMYQRVNNLFFPNFKLLCEVPIMALVIDEAIYLSTPLDECTTLTKRVKHRLEPVPMACEMSIMLGSLTGQIVEASWEGYDFEQCTIVTDESVQVAHVRGSIHDGPILAMERNPIVQSVFLSIGGHVLAISSQDDKSSPVFWRKKSAMVTAARWSLDRVSVFFIGLSNGDFEIWDLNLRTFRASICMNLGAEALTSISQHRLASARHCLAVADHNANIRIFAIAPGFVNPVPNEEETFRGMIQRELSRKAEQIGWCKAYYKRNAAAIEAQLQAEAEARELKLQEDAERVKTDATEGKSEASVKAKKAQELDKRLPLSERLEQKYQAKHFQTLLRQLMARRNVSPERMARQMRPVVERRRYNAEKRQAIDANLALMEGDFTGVHKLLRPAEKSTENRSTPDPNRSERVENLRQHIADYGRVESEAQEALRTHYLPTMESFTEVLMKSKDRRDRVSIVVGTNLHHLLGYENKRSLRRQGVAPRTLLEDLEPIGEDEDAAKDPDQAEEDDQANVNRKSVNN